MYEQNSKIFSVYQSPTLFCFVAMDFASGIWVFLQIQQSNTHDGLAGLYELGIGLCKSKTLVICGKKNIFF